MATPPSVGPLLYQAGLHTKHGQVMADIISRRAGVGEVIGGAIDSGLRTLVNERAKRTQLSMEEQDKVFVEDILRSVASGDAEPGVAMAALAKVRSDKHRDTLVRGMQGIMANRQFEFEETKHEDLKMHREEELGILRTNAATAKTRAETANLAARNTAENLRRTRVTHEIELETKQLALAAKKRGLRAEQYTRVGTNLGTNLIRKRDTMSGEEMLDEAIRRIETAPFLTEEERAYMTKGAITQLSKFFESAGNIHGTPEEKNRLINKALVFGMEIDKTIEQLISTLNIKKRFGILDKDKDNSLIAVARRLAGKKEQDEAEPVIEPDKTMPRPKLPGQSKPKTPPPKVETKPAPKPTVDPVAEAKRKELEALVKLAGEIKGLFETEPTGK